MRIAVLLYGQPRFFEYTWKYLQAEFSLPGVQFDFFIHFWDNVGFSPRDDKQQLYIDTNKAVKECITNLNVKKFKIENYNRLDVLCKSFNTVHNFLLKGSFKEVALSISRVIFSPTTDPIEPPINLKSITASAKEISSTLQRPVITPSFIPVLAWLSLNRSA